MKLFKRMYRMGLVLFLLVNVLSCKIADISQTSNLSIEKSEQVAIKKLDACIQAQGFDALKRENVYEFKATDNWPGFMGSLVKIWPDQKTSFLFKHNFNTFDGTAVFLDGKRQGDLIGVQSWTYYEKSKNTEIPQKKETKKKFSNLEFGLVIFHYFIELPYRLKSAPIKRYYGEKTLKGEQYDLVFASWGTEAANKEHDQYILWINKETQLVDYCIYTLRDNTNPFTRQKYGSIAYLDYQTINGFKVPFKMPILLDDGVVKKASLDKFFHQFSIQEFSFKSFDEQELYPFPDLKKQIDTK